MRFEHFAINVPDPAAMADWYVKHCDAKIVRSGNPPACARFLADAQGHVFMEIYANPNAPMPNYAAQEALVFHFAFATDDAGPVVDKWLAGGATLESDKTEDDGSRIVIVRDPWGVALQLCQRTERLTG